MADKYVVVKTNDSTNGTEEVVLAKDEAGNPTKFVSTTHPEKLSQDDLDVIGSLGVQVKKVSAQEAAEIEGAVEVVGASDTAGAAPVFGSGKIGR